MTGRRASCSEQQLCRCTADLPVSSLYQESYLPGSNCVIFPSSTRQIGLLEIKFFHGCLLPQFSKLFSAVTQTFDAKWLKRLTA